MSKKTWINLHLYPSSKLTNGSRMKRASELVAKMFPDCEVHLVGFTNAETEIINLDEQRVIKHLSVKTLPVPKTKTFQFHAIWGLKIIAAYLFKPVKVIQCHSVECLHIGAILKRLKPGVKLVYDPHELETERNGLTPRTQKIMRRIEERFIREADYVIPVGERIAEWYRNKYDLKNVIPILNMPVNPMKEFSSTPSTDLRKKFAISADDLLFVYQGALMQNRNIDLMLDVFARLPADRHLLFMGYGEFVPKIKTYVAKYPNIHFLDAVSPDKVLEHTAQTDVGLLIGENICLSYYYTLPNKFFEYILAGVPVAAVDFPELNIYVNKYNCGWLIPEKHTIDSVYEFVMSLTKEEVEKRKIDTKQARQFIGWHLVEPKLRDIYLDLLSSNEKDTQEEYVGV